MLKLTGGVFGSLLGAGAALGIVTFLFRLQSPHGQGFGVLGDWFAAMGLFGPLGGALGGYIGWQIGKRYARKG